MIVCGDDDSQTVRLVKLGHQIQQNLSVAPIEVGRGLVGQQDFRQVNSARAKATRCISPRDSLFGR